MANDTVTAMPKVVGKVDLEQFKKKTKELEYKQFGSFPVSLYTKAFGLAMDASKKIGIKNAITVSNKSKIRVNKPGGKFVYEEVPDKGSIWYACSVADLKKHFITPLHILEVAVKNNIRRLMKADFLHMSFGKEFHLMYVNTKGNIEIIKNIRVDGGEHEKEGICYKGVGQNTVYCLPFSDIKDDSTFKTGIEGEIGYFYIQNSENY